VALEAGFSIWSSAVNPGQGELGLARLQKHSPALLVLKAGNWHLSRAAADDKEAVQTSDVLEAQEALRREMACFDSACPVVLVVCLPPDQEAHFSEGLVRPGTFDRFLKLAPTTPLLLGTSFIDELGRERSGKSIVSAPAKVGFLIQRWFMGEDGRAMAILHLQRRHWRSGKAVEIADLLDVAMRGVVEPSDAAEPPKGPPRRVVAVHEAGHAVVSIIDSGGEDCPDYCSVMPGVDFQGVVVGSLEFHQLKDASLTYAKFRHSIRVSLAGRAAEEAVFGAEHVTNGAAADLLNCFRASAEAFTHFGFAPNMERKGVSGSNLAVVVGGPSRSEYQRMETLVRGFLAVEYVVVCRMLGRHRRLLDAVAKRMLWDPVVDQAELQQICRQLGIMPPGNGRRRPPGGSPAGNKRSGKL
jgi:hypothetical protein